MRAGWWCAAVLALAEAAAGQHSGIVPGWRPWLVTDAPVGAEQALVECLLPDAVWMYGNSDLKLFAERDALGSLIVRTRVVGTPPPVRLLLAVGIDEPTYVVSQIRDDGLLRVRTLARDAGKSFHLAREGRPVRIHARKATIPGVVLVNNLHLRGPRPDDFGEKDVFVDVGADSPAEVAALGVELLDAVSAGERVELAERFTADVAMGKRVIIDELADALRWSTCLGTGVGVTESMAPDVAVAFVVQSQVGAGPLGRGGEAVVRRLQPAKTFMLRASGEMAEALGEPVPIPGDGTAWHAVDVRVQNQGTLVEAFDARDRQPLRRAVRAWLGVVAPDEPYVIFVDPDFPTAESDPPGAFSLLQNLVSARGVSGHEQHHIRYSVRSVVREINRAWQPVQDEAGNLVLTLGDGPRHLAFVAHMDEIGLTVSAVREDGLLETERHGGFHDHLFRETAIELVKQGGAGEVLPAIALPRPADAPEGEDPVILLDVGARSAAEAAALGVAVGDPATVPKELRRLGAHRAAGRSPDDRVGCAALVLALRELGPDADAVLRAAGRRVTFAWVTREEVGLQGADHLARTLRPVPEVVFPVDTFVTSDSPREDPRWAFAKLGGGPVLRALDNTSLTPRATLDRVREVAAGRGIPLQIGVMGGGNDGSRFVPEGAIDCPLAWPQRNSHSRVETLDLRDYEALARLVAAVAAEF